MQNKHLLKVCSECGSAQSVNWTRHWKRQHPFMVPTQLEAGKSPNLPVGGWFEALSHDLQDLYGKQIFSGESASLGNNCGE